MTEVCNLQKAKQIITGGLDWQDIIQPSDKVIRILKKRAREMSRSGKVSRTFEFLCFFGAAEKIQAKVEANCTGFSAEFFGSQ